MILLKYSKIQYRSGNNFIYHQNNYDVERLMKVLQNNYVKSVDNLTKSLNILTTNLSVLHNYFDDPKLFLGLYLAKILNTSAKSFFLYTNTVYFYTFLSDTHARARAHTHTHTHTHTLSLSLSLSLSLAYTSRSRASYTTKRSSR